MSLRDTKLNLYLEQLEKIIPNIRLTSVSSFYNGNEPISGNIILSNISNAFKRLLGLKLNTHIIHFTSMETMLGVLSTESFRLYNCLNLNDPKEIEFANNKFSIGLTKEGTVTNMKYISVAVTLAFSGFGIGKSALVISSIALIFRFGLDIYCERFKPETITGLRRKVV